MQRGGSRDSLHSSYMVKFVLDQFLTPQASDLINGPACWERCKKASVCVSMWSCLPDGPVNCKQKRPHIGNQMKFSGLTSTHLLMQQRDDMVPKRAATVGLSDSFRV